jgi:hypothetical protein
MIYIIIALLTVVFVFVFSFILIRENLLLFDLKEEINSKIKIYKFLNLMGEKIYNTDPNNSFSKLLKIKIDKNSIHIDKLVNKQEESEPYFLNIIKIIKFNKECKKLLEEYVVDLKVQ